MRAGLILIAVLALAGCKREPTFAERYDAASGEIGKTAKDIDAQVSGAPIVSESDAAE